VKSKGLSGQVPNESKDFRRTPGNTEAGGRNTYFEQPRGKKTEQKKKKGEGSHRVAEGGPAPHFDEKVQTSFGGGGGGWNARACVGAKK